MPRARVWRPRTTSSAAAAPGSGRKCGAPGCPRRRQQQNSGEILTTFLAYKLDHAAEKMALGIAIGDPLTLLHEPTNPWDANAVQVVWKEQAIGYIPKDMAALIAARCLRWPMGWRPW